ncbi:MAG: glucose 1-dehydrogenase, partial [Anaerolineae bacterium]|nr:glucose 1-dehydrogenase [Anaerolineae bacterium]
MGRVAGKVAVVTGGALGIGRAICELLAAEGAIVAVTDILDDQGAEVATAIRSAGGQAQFWRMDVSNETSVQDTLAAIHAEYGALHILVNNAGVAGADKPTHEITEAEFDAVFAVDVKGVFFCTKHVVPIMRAGGGGSIVNLASIYALVGAPDIPPYHAAKGAVRLMTKTDAIFYAKAGIRVNCVHPGTIITELVEEMARNSPAGYEEYMRGRAAIHPIGHPGEPLDVAYGVLYLASDEAKFVTGAELAIDGG